MGAFFGTRNRIQDSPSFDAAKTSDSRAFLELLDTDLSAVGGGTGEVILGMPATPAPPVLP